MAKPFITAVASDFVCGHARFILPLRALVERGLSGADVAFRFVPNQQSAVTSGGVVLVQREAHLGQQMYAHLRSAGCGIVHDIDDLLWDVPSDNPAYSVMDQNAKDVMFAAMREANVVTCSTENLRGELAQLGISAFVLPNVLDPHEWAHLTVPKAPRVRPRVGWYGQRSVHVADLALLDHVVRALMDEVQWVFLGDLPAPLQDLANRLEYHHQIGLPFFPATFAQLDLDLMLAPLAHNRFNESKSNLRLLHAGAVGYPVVATAISAYAGLPVKLVPNEPTAWVNAIRERLADPPAMRKEGEALREFVLRNYMVDAHVSTYLSTWLRSIPQPVPVMPGVAAG